MPGQKYFSGSSLKIAGRIDDQLSYRKFDEQSVGSTCTTFKNANCLTGPFPVLSSAAITPFVAQGIFSHFIPECFCTDL